jgi:hypothetical protein
MTSHEKDIHTVNGDIKDCSDGRAYINVAEKGGLVRMRGVVSSSGGSEWFVIDASVIYHQVPPSFFDAMRTWHRALCTARADLRSAVDR